MYIIPPLHMYEHMYVSVCMYICVYTSACFSMYGDVHHVTPADERTYVWRYMCMCVCASVCKYARRCRSHHLCTCMCLCMYVSAYVYTHVCVRVCTYVRQCMAHHRVYVCLYFSVSTCIAVQITPPLHMCRVWMNVRVSSRMEVTCVRMHVYICVCMWVW